MDKVSAKSPGITLNNGITMPALGFGVYRIAPDHTANAVLTALEAGYRLIDTAAAYNNERGVGAAIAKSDVPRSEVFVTSKLWPTDYGYESALKAFDKSLDKLGLDYVDMYLLHWPFPSDFSKTVGAYHALERELRNGRVRTIGVCNHNTVNLERLIAETDTVAAVNQVELHPFFTQKELVQTHKRLGITTQAWSPLGGVNIYDAADPGKARHILAHPVITSIAERTGKTPGQVVLRWHIQQGHSAIPKSIHPQRIAVNMAIFDFELTPEDIAAIGGLDTGIRGGDDPQSVTTETYPVTIES